MADLTSMTWLALTSEVLIKSSYSFDVGDDEFNKLRVGLTAKVIMTVSAATQIIKAIIVIQYWNEVLTKCIAVASDLICVW